MTLPALTQRFVIALATDGDVSYSEIQANLEALGYHGVLVTGVLQDHEHPCPSTECLDRLRSEGHMIPGDADCCMCWGNGW